MQETIQQMSNQVTEKWNNLTKKQKILIGVGVATLIIAMVAVSLMARPKYKVLFSEPVEDKFMQQVTEVLTEKKIKYRIIDDSTNIEVEENAYQEAKMYTASLGITETGISLEQLLNNDMSTTQSEMDLKSKEYLRESLQKALKTMDGVEDARVELVIPEQKNAYLQSQVESNASVFLTLSKPLTSVQCETIATYVASSVQNLKKENVVVIDSTGKTLYTGQEDQNTTVGKQQELKLAAEAEMKQKVENLLTSMYDDVRISPNLVLDFDQYQEKKEEYATQGDDESRGVVQHETESKSSSTNANAGDVPGTDTNGGDTPTYQTIDGSASESKENSKEITYAPDKKESNYIKNSGDIDFEQSSISVNLFRNKIYKEEMVTPTLTGMTWEEFKEANRLQTALTVEENLISLVKSATGLENVVVNAYENPIFLDQEVYAIDYKDYIVFILLGAALLIILFIMLKFRKQEEVVEVEPELEVEEMLKAAKEQVELEEIELKENLETKRQIDKFVDEKPEAVANLLRNWLADEDWE
ncbi:MAG: flagellar M-ring protein FliF [Cellulosilyticum sp.]|nr:flagellar M-ring protein FliF [Cellulosilyticum sp.]